MKRRSFLTSIASALVASAVSINLIREPEAVRPVARGLGYRVYNIPVQHYLIGTVTSY